MVRAAPDPPCARAEGPREKISPRPEIVIFFANQLARFLEDIFGIVRIGNQRVDVGKDAALVGGQERHEEFAFFNFGIGSHGGSKKTKDEERRRRKGNLGCTRVLGHCRRFLALEGSLESGGRLAGGQPSPT